MCYSRIFYNFQLKDFHKILLHNSVFEEIENRKKRLIFFFTNTRSKDGKNKCAYFKLLAKYYKRNVNKYVIA